MGIKVVTGSRYLGGFIGESAAEKSWLASKVSVWAESVETLVAFLYKHLQFAYAVLQQSLQQGWAFV